MSNNIVTQRFVKCHDQLKADNRVRSSRQFALSLDYLPQSLSEILKGRRDATIELLRKAIEVYQMNPVYIFTGEGPMFMSEDNDQGFRVLTIVNTPQEDEQIVHVPAPAQAAYAGDEAKPNFIQSLPTFTLPDYKYKVGTHRSFDISGDSMEPTLFEGDKVVCSFLDSTLWEKSLKDNYVYVIVTRGDVLIRRLENRLKTDKEIIMHSDNSYYEPHSIKRGDIREIWYVRAKISPFLPSPQNIRNMMRDEVQDLKRMITEQTEALQALRQVVEKKQK